jgi:hypothetical protein
MDELLKQVEGWVTRLEEATECDADYGDPILCLEEVDLISKKMREVVSNYKMNKLEEMAHGK